MKTSLNKKFLALFACTALCSFNSLANIEIGLTLRTQVNLKIMTSVHVHRVVQ